MIELQKYANTENWFNYKGFYKWIVSHENFKIFIEVGVWKGHSISYLAELLINRKNIKIYAVDLFDDTYLLDYYGLKGSPQEGHLWEIYNYNLKLKNVRHIIQDIKMLSWEAAKKFKDNSVDFVFIDADHSYEAVKKDISAWWPKIKKGGIISGHDYKQEAYPGVEKAVIEFFGSVNEFKYDIGDAFCWYKEKI